jgi:hypothetical protein
MGMWSGSGRDEEEEDVVSEERGRRGGGMDEVARSVSRKSSTLLISIGGTANPSDRQY